MLDYTLFTFVRRKLSPDWLHVWHGSVGAEPQWWRRLYRRWQLCHSHVFRMTLSPHIKQWTSIIKLNLTIFRNQNTKECTGC